MANVMELINLCKGKHIYIQTHNFPDPDAIASSYGLQKLFENYAIESTICYVGKIDKISTKRMTELFNIEMYAYEELEGVMKPEDYIVCVDSQKNGGNILDLLGDEIACIDHHPTYCEVSYLYSDIRMTGSCATIIAGYFRDNDIEMDEITATALLYGLKMDTLQFSRGVKLEDIKVFEFLFDKANMSMISELEHSTMEFDDLRAYGAAIESIELYDKIGFAKIPFACPDALIATVSDFILNLDEVELTVVYSQRDNGFKFSVRSEMPEISAGELIHRALEGIGNGGGHASMAGGFVDNESIKQLGHYPDDRIKEIIIGLANEMAKQVSN